MLLSALILCTLVAQPEPSAIEAAQRFSEAYDGPPFAERAHISFTSDTGETTTFDTLIRQGSFAGVRHTALSLPGLRLHFAERTLTAERTDQPNKAVVFRVTDAGDSFLGAISPHVPAMPMPQLWRFDDEGKCADPALGVIEAIAFDADLSLLTLQSQAGRVELRIDAESCRASALDAPLGDGEFHATYESTDPGEVSAWTIPTAGRWIVTRLAQLTPPREPIEPGIQLDDLHLMSPAYQGWKLSEIQGDELIRQSGPWVVLLMCRSDADDSVFELAGKVASELWHAAAEEVARRDDEDIGRYWFGHRSIVVAVSGELEVLPEQMRTLAERSPKGVPLLVSTEPRKTVDRLTIPAPLTAVLIDPTRTVGAVVPIENAETGVSAVMSAMRSFVRQRAEPEDTAQPPTESDG
ncbi:MAG: hypothetical protein KDA31_12800 [Phycisphaerales bacterium]|nr:hypothetical protein [Phycisphaerales bacterium]MCB9836669.1 hypothetical protein [Phycisphaera sp.]